ncbi:hypothetical protein DFH07DRAFT_188834 [Mycena maculata]|uniref:Uncharacterized protein n=1 Tax=Mycena maculata TaxID=230809 RepID=A0AAD7KFC6_9AGAR|nr:hypothetical protein DFH07DRAFT_188834 [Mycena maculata]
MGEFPSLINCTRLSIVVSDPEAEEVEDPALENVESMIFALGKSLGKWKHLRHFQFGCTFSGLWDEHTVFESPSMELVYDSRPPMRGDTPLDFKVFCDEQLDYIDLDEEEFLQAVRDLEVHDTCTMQLWGKLHESEMALKVGHLAKACPTLESISFSMRAPGFDAVWIFARIHRCGIGAFIEIRLVVWNGFSEICLGAATPIIRLLVWTPSSRSTRVDTLFCRKVNIILAFVCRYRHK